MLCLGSIEMDPVISVMNLFIRLCLGSIVMDPVIKKKHVIKGQFYKGKIKKNPIILLQNSKLKISGSHNMTVIYPNPSYNKVFYKPTALYFCLFVFVALRPKSTAMVIAGRSVHLTTLFSWASLNKQLTSNRAHTFACN